MACSLKAIHKSFINNKISRDFSQVSTLQVTSGILKGTLIGPPLDSCDEALRSYDQTRDVYYTLCNIIEMISNGSCFKLHPCSKFMAFVKRVNCTKFIAQ